MEKVSPFRELEINTDQDELIFPDTAIFRFKSIYDITDKTFFMWSIKGELTDILPYSSPLIIAEDRFAGIDSRKFVNSVKHIQKRMLEQGFRRVYYTDKKTLFEFQYKAFPETQKVLEFKKIHDYINWMLR